MASADFPLVGAFEFSVLRAAKKEGAEPFDKEGSLEKTDPVDKVLTRSHHKVFQEKLDADTAYVFELASPAFGPYLRIF